MPQEDSRIAEQMRMVRSAKNAAWIAAIAAIVAAICAIISAFAVSSWQSDLISALWPK